MSNQFVMRSFYLSAKEDSRLRKLAFDLDLTKSDLLRAAISRKLGDWTAMKTPEDILNDIKLGDREAAERDAETSVLALRASSRSRAGGRRNAPGQAVSEPIDM